MPMRGEHLTGKDFSIIMNSDKQMQADTDSIIYTQKFNTHDFDCQMNDSDQSTSFNQN